MQTFQQRVIDEKTDLDNKLSALGNFIDTNPIFDALPADERERLRAQYAVMRVYSEILGRRITAFAAS